MHILSKSGVVDDFNKRKPGAITWVYNHFYADVFRIVEKLVGYSTDNEDLVGEVFLKIIDTKTQMESFKKLRDFIYMTSRTTSLDHIRKQELIQGSDMCNFYKNLNDHDKEQADLHTTFDNLINNAASSLPGKYQRIIIMFYYDGMSIEEIAGEMRLSEKTIANLKSDALKKLKLEKEKSTAAYIFYLFSFL